jgi:hypothetical protein
MTAETKPKRDNKGKWLPGQSANPAGKPKGGVTDLRRQLSEHGEALASKLIDMALAGDVAALKICFDKLVPSLKPVSHKSERITLPPGANLSEKAMTVIEAAGLGKLDTSEAATLISGLAACARIIETDELVKRIQLLEEK